MKLKYLAASFLTTSLLCCSCVTRSVNHLLLVSVRDQKMALYEQGERVATYPVSTSKFGLGDRPGSNRTPVGEMEVTQKIGGGQPMGMVFKSRRPTGKILRPNTPDEDSIVTRILRLRGREASTRNTFGRFIYIHGTVEERKIGQPASHGCIRMRSRDIVDLYDRVAVGARVRVTTESLPPSPLAQLQENAALVLGNAAQGAANILQRASRRIQILTTPGARLASLSLP